MAVDEGRHYLVTGGAGFIGSNFIRFLLAREPGSRVTNFDKLTYAGNLENLADVEEDPRYRLIRGDVCHPEEVEAAFGEKVDVVVHFAAESHVDRSIEDAADFVRTNVLGTHTLLEVARRRGITRFIQISTDEVYGSLGPTGAFREDSPLHPNSPYAASKAAADLLVLATHHTFGFPAIILRCSNNYGPYQFPEKLIPLMVSNALEDKPLPVYGDGHQVRDWIHVEDHCAAVHLAITAGRPGEVYNIGGHGERKNIDVVQTLLSLLGKPQSLIQYVDDRKGHDRRYAIDSTKISHELGWKPQRSFEEGLAATVEWYQSNRPWWESIKRGDYQTYYARVYGEKGLKQV